MGQDRQHEYRHVLEMYGNPVIAAAVAYIKLRNSGHGHTSAEGIKLNETVKAYLQAIQS